MGSERLWEGCRVCSAAQEAGGGRQQAAGRRPGRPDRPGQAGRGYVKEPHQLVRLGIFDAVFEWFSEVEIPINKEASKWRVKVRAVLSRENSSCCRYRKSSMLKRAATRSSL